MAEKFRSTTDSLKRTATLTAAILLGGEALLTAGGIVNDMNRKELREAQASVIQPVRDQASKVLLQYSDAQVASSPIRDIASAEANVVGDVNLAAHFEAEALLPDGTMSIGRHSYRLVEAAYQGQPVFYAVSKMGETNFVGENLQEALEALRAMRESITVIKNGIEGGTEVARR